MSISAGRFQSQPLPNLTVLSEFSNSDIAVSGNVNSDKRNQYQLMLTIVQSMLKALLNTWRFSG